jgi:hypothetical protein
MKPISPEIYRFLKVKVLNSLSYVAYWYADKEKLLVAEVSTHSKKRGIGLVLPHYPRDGDAQALFSMGGLDREVTHRDAPGLRG